MFRYDSENADFGTNIEPEEFVSSKSVAAVGDRSFVRGCDVTTESDGARNSIAQNNISHHRTRNQITHKLRR